ncbi:MAG: outer membrane beta-barrel protein [Chitinophagales bacterium]
MKIPTLILLFNILSSLLSAQSHVIAIKTGFSWTNISSSLHEYEFQNNYIAGISYDYKVNKNLSLGCEFLYEERGGNLIFTFNHSNGNPQEQYTVPYEFNYFSLPIKLSYTIGNVFFGFCSIGVCPAMLRNSIVTYPDGYLDHFVDPMATIPPTYSKFDFAGFSEIGCGYKLSDRFSIDISGRFQQSTTLLIENLDGSNFGVTIGLGLKYYF